MSTTRTRGRSRAAAAALLVLTVLVGLVVPLSGTSSAAAPPPTVTTDPLPTPQVDGVVWTQKVVGGVVFAGGTFATARPAGAAPGVGTVPRGNLLAYDVRTGALLPPFTTGLNGAVRALAVSADGSRLYVGGDFTTASGAKRLRVAAYSTSTYALVGTFAPAVDSTVNALAVKGDTVYAGGTFSTVAGVARARLAAVRGTDGALLPWAPAASAKVTSLLVTPSAAKVVVGGSFTTLSGVAALGIGAVDATTGAVAPWATNRVVRASGAQAGITSLSTDGTSIFGTSYVFVGGQGNLEGSFAADPVTGAVRWVEDCHGDTYSSFPSGGVLYTVGHAHDCANLPTGFPTGTGPHRALAFTTAATGTVAPNSVPGYSDLGGSPAPSLLRWWPDLTPGQFTGQLQAAWSVTGNADYVVLGGEFLSVNGVPQQGLVRLAKTPIAPARQGPVLSGGAWPLAASSQSLGTVRATIPADWDRDDATLSYELLRDGATTPVARATATSTFWDRPAVAFTDTGLVPGSTHTYQVAAVDPAGNRALSRAVSVVVSAAAPGAYPQAVRADGASAYWRLDEPSGTVGYDAVATDDLTLSAGTTRGTPGSLVGDTDTAATFNGVDPVPAVSTLSQVLPATGSSEVWLTTTSASGGKVLGFGSSRTGPSPAYDRQLWMDAAGHLLFGVVSGTPRVLTSAGTYNDGVPHHVVATAGADGSVLYVDGRVVGRDPNPPTASFPGYWRVGGDTVGTWPGAPASGSIAGTLDEVAVYPTVLTVEQVRAHYTASGRSLVTGLPPTDPYGAAVYASRPDGFWRLDETGGTVADDATPRDADAVYLGGTTPGRPGALVGGQGTAVALDGTTGGLASAAPVRAPTVYSTSAWFRTTTARGGLLVGFGNAQTGLSTAAGRQVWMSDDGRLHLGVHGAPDAVVDSPLSYADGRYHAVVATQDATAMRLYVDGALVASRGPAPVAVFDGYWRAGVDTLSTWAARPTSNAFAGTLDEVAVWSRALSPAEVAAAYAAGTTPVDTPPTASFAPSVAGLTASLDASASADPDGTVVAYSWDFGDGSAPGSGVRVDHTYAQAGTYPVTLTVTDDRGATGTVTAPVATTSTGTSELIAGDGFDRVVTSGLGTADLGGDWRSAGSVSSDGSRAVLTTGPGTTASAFLPALAETGTDVTATVSTDRVADGGGSSLSVLGRRVAAGSDYRLKVRSAGTAVTVQLFRTVGGVETALTAAVPTGVVPAAGRGVRVRLQLAGSGTTALAGKAWADGAPEPAAWGVTATDTTSALQVPGSVGMLSFLAGTATGGPVAVRVDDLAVVRPPT